MVESSTCVFVYGTLMPGKCRWTALRPYAVSWQAATARGRLWDTGCGYPAARFDDDAAAVPGVVVALAPGSVDDAIAVLDGIEGEGRLYRRVEVATSAGPALGYEWLGPLDGLVPLAYGWEPARSADALSAGIISASDDVQSGRNQVRRR